MYFLSSFPQSHQWLTKNNSFRDTDSGKEKIPLKTSNDFLRSLVGPAFRIKYISRGRLLWLLFSGLRKQRTRQRNESDDNEEMGRLRQVWVSFLLICLLPYSIESLDVLFEKMKREKRK